MQLQQGPIQHLHPDEGQYFSEGCPTVWFNMYQISICWCKRPNFKCKTYWFSSNVLLCPMPTIIGNHCVINTVFGIKFLQYQIEMANHWPGLEISIVINFFIVGYMEILHNLFETIPAHCIYHQFITEIIFLTPVHFSTR